MGTRSITADSILNDWCRKFQSLRIPQPNESAKRIIKHVLANKTIFDNGNSVSMPLSPAEEDLINSLCTKRMKRMPVPYIIRECEFHGVRLKMTPPVFIPMVETEKTVDLALEAIDVKRADTVLELCCGSGAISLAILEAQPQVKLIAIDKFDKACKLTKENADALGLSRRLRIINATLTAREHIQGMFQKFDVMVSNPPSVPINDIEDLGPEFTKYMALEAVNGGDDGLNMIKIVLIAASRMLNLGGIFILEVNPTLCDAIKPWLEDNNELGLTLLRSFKDFNGFDRYVKIVKDK